MKISVAKTTSLNARLAMRRSCAALRAAAIFMAVWVSAAPALAESTPPLLPGEVYVKTQNGCGVIFQSSNSDDPKHSDAGRMKSISESTWTGTCMNGLANGLGRVGKPGDDGEKVGSSSEFAYGRQIFGKQMFSKGIDGPTVVYNKAGGYASFPNIADPFSPRWRKILEEGVRTFLYEDKFAGGTEQSNCYHVTNGMFPGCTRDNNFQVYGIKVMVKDGFVTTWCPNPRTSKGCEALWQEKAGPSIARIKALVAETENKIAEDKRKYAELTAPWIESEAAKKIAAEVEVKRQEALKSIAREKDRDIAALEQQERDEYEAKEKEYEAKAKEKSEKAFRASLKKLNAGELYALADKKRTAGELDKAREILRTLITKYPDNPLVAVAAQQMSQLPAAPEVAATIAKPPVPAKTKAPNRDIGLEEMSGVFGGPRN